MREYAATYNHLPEVLERRRAWKWEKYHSDPAYRAHKQAQARERYQRKKLLQEVVPE